MLEIANLPSLVELEAERLRRSFYQFVKASWHLVEPETPFVDGWHIRAITSYLQAIGVHLVAFVDQRSRENS